MKRLFSFILLLFLIVVKSQAQACFTPEKNTFCIGEDVKIIDCSGYISGSGNVEPQYDYDINDGIIEGKTISDIHQYSKAGDYTIEQIYTPPGATTPTVRHTVHVLPTLPPTFDLLNCQGFQVTVKITDEYEGLYQIDFGDGSPSQTVAKDGMVLHVYPDASSRTITVTGGCGSPNKKTITPFNTLVKPDVLSLQLTNNNTLATLNLNAISYLKYKILQKSANSASYDTIDTVEKRSGLINLSYPISAPGNATCYKIVTYDDCGNTATSETLCSDEISATSQNNQNDISWLKYTGPDFSRYVLYKNSTQLTTSTDINNLSFIDPNIVCGKTDCYKIITELSSTNLVNGEPVKSITDSVCVKGVSNNIPPALQNVNSSIEGNKAKISWDDNGLVVVQYHLLRSDQSNPNSFNSPSPYFDDKVNVNAENFCYSIEYDNVCGNSSPYSGMTCPVLLKVSQPDDQTNILNWTTYNNQSNVSYTVEKLDAGNNIISSMPGNLLTYTDGPIDASVLVNRYRIRAELNGFISYSNIVEVRNDLQIYAPTAFSPNGTGPEANEIFKIYGRGIKEFEIKIFNRWGEMVYYSNDFDLSWDGRYKGSIANADAYAYLIQAKDKSGKTITKKGTVTLLR